MTTILSPSPSPTTVLSTIAPTPAPPPAPSGTSTPLSPAVEVFPQTWVLILLTGVVAGLVVGLLTYARSKGDWPTTLLAALASAGATIVGIHQILGG